MKNPTNKTIFISYSWNDRDIVDKIEKGLKPITQLLGISLIRDTRDLKYNESVEGFMKRVKNEDYVLMLITDNYLKSENCTFEINEFLRSRNKDSMLRITHLDNVKDNDGKKIDFYNKKGTEAIKHYINYWEKEQQGDSR